MTDARRHCVVCFDLAAGRLLATFGRAEEAGASLSLLSRPTAIAAGGSRAVVFDAGNQRLLKLRLAADGRAVRANRGTSPRPVTD